MVSSLVSHVWRRSHARDAKHRGIEATTTANWPGQPARQLDPSVGGVANVH